MKTYYIGNVPFNGENSISHGRTKGSRNGISTTPGYKAIGKLAQKVYGAASGAYNSARKGVTSAYNSVSKSASGAYNSARKGVTGAYNSARKGVTSAYNSGKEFLTGSNAKQRLSNARQSNSGRIGWTDDSVNKARRNLAYFTKIKNRYGADLKGHIDPSDTKARRRRSENLHEYQKAKEDIDYNRSVLTDSERQRNSAATHRALLEAQAQREYNKTLPGKISKASKNAQKATAKAYDSVSKFASDTYNNARKGVNDAYDSVSKFASDTYKGASKAAAGAYKDVSSKVDKFTKNAEKALNESYEEAIDWLDKNGKKAAKTAKSVSSTLSKSAGKAVSSIKSTASSTSKKVGNFFQNIFGKKK